MSSIRKKWSAKQPSPTSPNLTQLNMNARTVQSASPGLCDNCRVMPKFTENGRVHPYCGRRCAAAHKRVNQQVPPRNSQWQPLNQPQNDWMRNPADCLLQDCKNTGMNQFGGYCSDQHSKLVVRKKVAKSCSECGRSLAVSSGDLCVSCQRIQGTTSLKELPNTDINYKSVIQYFVDGWNPASSNKRTPRVMKVLEVNLSRKAQNSYEAYRKTLGKRPTPSEFVTFHSSQCVCDLGTQSQQQLCEHTTCGICSIVRSNFTDFGCGAKTNVGRFGPGVYSYTNSSRADTHATSCTSSPYRAMILCSVLIDKASTTNSRIFEDTVVVKDANAIIPTHVILYS